MKHRIFRRICIMAGILTLLSSFFGCRPRDGITGSDGAGDKAPDNESGLVFFYYQYLGYMGGDDFSYQVQEKDGKVILTYKSLEHEDYGEMTKEMDEAFLNRLNDLYKSCRLAAWDGFKKTDTMVLDGNGFSIMLSFRDGKTMTASGTNVLPAGYRVFKEAMDKIFEPVISELLEVKKQEMIDAGIEGSLTSVMATFKQQGASGSDSYNIVLFPVKIKADNFDVTIHSESGEFLPQGYYRLAVKTEDQELRLDDIQALIEKYELIKWYDWHEASEEPNDSEWFQLSLGFSGGQTLRAMGTAHPEHYEEFRHDFLQLISECYKKVASLSE